MTATLSTHVLDTARGVPAAGLAIQLKRCRPDAAPIGEFVTGPDGRVDGGLLTNTEAIPGTYELTFHAGDYLRECGVILAEPPFLDVIPIRFGLGASGHYHVPLLLSPYGYSTYRGS